MLLFFAHVCLADGDTSADVGKRARSAPGSLHPQERYADDPRLHGEKALMLTQERPSSSAITITPLLQPDTVTVDGTRYRIHGQGGGLVSVHARVGDNVLVAPGAKVKDTATVLDCVRLFDRAVVEDEALVTGWCTLRGGAHVGGCAIVGGQVNADGETRIDGTAHVEGGIKLQFYAHVSAGHLSGSYTVS